MTERSFGALLERAKTGNAYWVDKAAVDFTEGLCEMMQKHGVSRAELARRIGVNRSYITKILRGNANLTLETMVKLTRAVDGDLEVRVRPPMTSHNWSAVASKTTSATSRLFKGFNARQSDKPVAGDRSDAPIAA